MIVDGVVDATCPLFDETFFSSSVFLAGDAGGLVSGFVLSDRSLACAAGDGVIVGGVVLLTSCAVSDWLAVAELANVVGMGTVVLVAAEESAEAVWVDDVDPAAAAVLVAAASVVL